jgi:hypothetical protein
MGKQCNIEIICRQTNYSAEEAEKLLNENNDDVIKVIKHYMNIYKKPEECCKTISQERYRLIRKDLDFAYETYRKSKEN